MYVVGINHSQERGKEARKGKGALKGSYERKDGKEFVTIVRVPCGYRVAQLVAHVGCNTRVVSLIPTGCQNEKLRTFMHSLL